MAYLLRFSRVLEAFVYWMAPIRRVLHWKISCNFSRNFLWLHHLPLDCSQSPIFPYDGRDQRLCVTVGHLGWVSNLLRGLGTVHMKPGWPLVPVSTRSWRCNEKIGACEQSPLTQNITTIQTTHGQRGAFPSAARDCTFLCAIKKVRYNSRREEILANTFPFLFTLTSVTVSARELFDRLDELKFANEERIVWQTVPPLWWSY